MRAFLKRLLGRDLLQAQQQQLALLNSRTARLESALGALLAAHARTAPSMAAAEFKMFSQWGDDGIIQFLVANVPLSVPRFIEFGVEDYAESNTRFLLLHNQWQGLVMDGSAAHVAHIQRDPISWQYGLQSKCAFITAENINTLISEAGFAGPVGLLHIDIDGNDYWVWQALTACAPQLVIMEFNHLFGADRPITIPYSADFVRTRAHYSGLYAGAGLAALHHLAIQKGYKLIGINRAGNNAYFLQQSLAPQLPALSPQQAFHPAHFVESRDTSGQLSFLSAEKSLALLAGLPVVNVVTGNQETL